MTNQGTNRLEAIILNIDPNSAPDAIDPDAPRLAQGYQQQGTGPESPRRYGDPPKNWLVESILVTLFCCLPFGIVGIINAANVNSRFGAGDIGGANKASEEAKKWTKIGFFIGLGIVVLYLIYALILGGTALRLLR